MSLKNKIVIVTGAASGIGAAIALEAMKEGAEVTAADRNKEKLDKVVADCKEATGREPLAVIAELTNEEQAKNVVVATVKRFGKIDVLVNNAGFGRLVSIEDDDALEIFDSIMQTNLRAAVHLTKLAVPYLAATKGNIVNISSANSMKTRPNLWAYCASKAALDSFSKNMAVTLAPKGIRVNTVNPGPVKTEFNGNLGLTDEKRKARSEKTKSMTVLGRYSEAKEVADLVLFVAGDKGVGITGSSYVIDNGWLVK